MKQLLQVVQIIHEIDIFHRDIKPGNIVFDSKTYDMMLVDWGLAEFYFFDKNYNRKISTRPYKPPEILLGDQFYDKKIDMWGVGQVLASLVFKKPYIFLGKNDLDQIITIFEFLGTDQINDFLNDKGLTIQRHLNNFLKAMPKKRPIWQKFSNGSNSDLLDHKTINFLELLLSVDPVFQKEKKTNS